MPLEITPSWKLPNHKLWKCSAAHCTFRVLTLNGDPTSHKCPYYGGETRIAFMPYGATLLEQMWNEMDRVTGDLMSGNLDSDQFPITRGRARGVAFTLSLFMVPHFRTEDEIVAEAVKRWNAKQAGETYETAGLGSRIYEPPPGDTKSALRAQPAHPTQSTQTAVKQRSNVTAEQFEAIRNSSFPVDLLAKAYHITPAEVQAIQSSS